MPSKLRQSGSTRAWRELRKWWADRLPTACARCGEPVLPTDDWHLDHLEPRVLGGSDYTARPSHAACNRSHGAKLAGELQRLGAKTIRDNKHSEENGIGNGTEPPRFLVADKATLAPRLASLSLSEEPEPDIIGLTVEDSAWDSAEWLKDLRSVPPEASWPRLMTVPHPSAVGSFGWELVEFAKARSGRELRYWQKLVAVRLLEHDDSGNLVWLWLLLSTSRQVGKTWLLRTLAEWRLEQGERFGEPQDILHTAKDVAVAKEAQRPTKAWARRHAADGWRVREANGQDEITAPDGSRWLLRARDAVYSYGASLGIVDEAWKVKPSIVDDGLEPTMAERVSAQGVLASTAHRRATGLFPSRRGLALAELAAPRDTLLMEWSAPYGLDLADPAGWRMASPFWSDRRERLLASKLDRARRGRSDDPEEDDPLESFRSQWLNTWPSVSGGRTLAGDERLLDDGLWPTLADVSVVLPASGLVGAVEDYYGAGSAASVAGLLPDGRLVVCGQLFARRSEAFEYVDWLAGPRPGSRLLVGASLGSDPGVAKVGVSSVAAVTQTDTRSALPGLRELVANGRLVHDGGLELANQVDLAWVRRSPSGGLVLSARSGRSDLLRCAAWSLAVADRAVAVVSARPEVW